MEEVPIPSELRSEIEEDAGFNGTARSWRLYACFEPQSDIYVNAIFGFDDVEENITAPFVVDCPNCTGENKFYQSPFGDLIGALINPLVPQVLPIVRYDSWFTLGEPPYPTETYQYTGQADATFEAGGAYEDFSELGSAVFFVPAQTPVLAGRPGLDGRVLLGQFTSDGIVEGNISIQYRFLDGNGVPLADPPIPEYNLSFSSDGSLPISCEGYGTGGCTDPNACNFNNNALFNNGTCFYANAVFDCDGNCQMDVDGNGICDQLEPFTLNCGPGTVWDPTSGQCVVANDCPADLNNDNQIDTSDLLSFLTAFGNDCQ